MLNSRWLLLIAVLVVAACGAGGYAIGAGSAPDASEASDTKREAFTEAKRDAQQTAFEAAKRQGAKKGVAEGRRAGVQAGETAGLEAAGGEVEAELAAIAEEQAAAEEAAAAAAAEAAASIDCGDYMEPDGTGGCVPAGPSEVGLGPGGPCPPGFIRSGIPPYDCVVPGPEE